jgi:hypothetical protein
MIGHPSGREDRSAAQRAPDRSGRAARSSALTPIEPIRQSADMAARQDSSGEPQSLRGQLDGTLGGFELGSSGAATHRPAVFLYCAVTEASPGFTQFEVPHRGNPTCGSNAVRLRISN